MSSVTLKILALSFLATFMRAQPAVYKLADLQSRISDPDTLFIVNFWATWCKPCVGELPSFDSLHVKYSASPVKVLLVSLDFTEDLQTRLVPFIRDRKVQAECVLLDEPDGNTFINSIDPAWSGAIPATLVKKADTKKFAEGSLTTGAIEKMIFSFTGVR